MEAEDNGADPGQSLSDDAEEPSPDSATVGDEKEDVESDDSAVSENGTKYWIPACPSEMKPTLGMFFQSIQDASKWYDEYGVRCKFDVRRGSSVRKDGFLKLKRFYCNRQGFNKPPPTLDSVDGVVNQITRRTASFRCGCPAAIAVKVNDSGGYAVSEFIERHNHKLSHEGSQFLKHKRKMKSFHKRHILKCAAVNMGSVKAHKIAKQLVGGFNDGGPQVNDFRTWHRDVNACIGDHDADMVIDHLNKKKAVYESFYWDMSLSKGKLTNIFWADPLSQMHFHAFGDVVSFDATYQMNKYNLIFVPFTGVDNHMKSVTFAAALISSEDVESYTWILEQFIKCMGRAPSVILTDQDPALRQVVPRIMPHTHHRFCMWHIMKKLSSKVGYTTVLLQEFISKLKAVVYNYHVDPQEFEDNWHKVLNEYEMADNKWLSDMFEIRAEWIPAYFRDIPLGGLLRTTSRSESANSFFGGFLNHRLTLLGFFTGFETAIESQRHKQALTDHDTEYRNSTKKTPLPIEIHALNTYTRTVFLDVQAEIAASCYKMSAVEITQLPSGSIHKFDDHRYNSCIFQVNEDRTNGTVTCTCKLYDRVGYLCRHVFAVLKNGRVNEIPSTYVLNRWTRNAIHVASERVPPLLREDCKIMKRVPTSAEAGKSDIYSDFEACINYAEGNPVKMAHMALKIKKLRAYLEDENDDAPAPSKETVISDLIGAKRNAVVTVKPPSYVRTKGSGKRLVSERDQAIKKSERTPRTCKACNKPAFHDSRNCPG